MSSIITIALYKNKHRTLILQQFFYPFTLTMLSNVILLTTVYVLSMRYGGRDFIYATSGRHDITPSTIIYIMYILYLYEYIQDISIYLFISHRYFTGSVISIILEVSSISASHNFYKREFSKYGVLLNSQVAYVIPMTIAEISWALKFNTSYTFPKENFLTNLSYINAIAIDNKNLNEKLTIQAFDSNGNNVLILQEFFPEYSVHSYFKFGTNTDQYANIKIFNQNGIDRTQDLYIGLYTNTSQ